MPSYPASLLLTHENPVYCLTSTACPLYQPQSQNGPKAQLITAQAEGLGKQPRRRRYLSAEGRSTGAAEATELPSSMPEPNSTLADRLGRRKAVQARRDHHRLDDCKRTLQRLHHQLQPPQAHRLEGRRSDLRDQ